MKSLISVIIVNYNTEKLLEACLCSIREQTKQINYEVIVVDNNSLKGSLNPLIDNYPDVLFHQMDSNAGFGVANNIGAELAHGDFLFFLNPDTILMNNALLILHKYMVQYPAVGACGGNLYNENMQSIVSYHVMDFYTREWRILLNRKRTVGFNNTGQALEVNAIMGADLFTRQSVFKEVGGFDPDFFMYFEEIELCDRIQKAGYKVVSVPDATIIHIEGGASEEGGDELSKWSYQEHWYSKFLYFHKTNGRLSTKLIYRAYMLKLRLAVYYYRLKRNTSKLDEWAVKKKVITDTYGRYMSFITR
ncbi:MAG: hypothetical protein RL662_2352 [Bacteroidota bacterium]|jgi:GT2 family glycosyltransferase